MLEWLIGEEGIRSVKYRMAVILFLAFVPNVLFLTLLFFRFEGPLQTSHSDACSTLCTSMCYK